VHVPQGEERNIALRALTILLRASEVRREVYLEEEFEFPQMKRRTKKLHFYSNLTP
jgi:hypothetical protein